MSSNFDGLNDLKKLQKQLNDIADNVKEVVEEYDDVPINSDELFTSDFMNFHTDFDNFDDWMKAGGFSTETQEDFDNIDESELDLYVSKSTDFQSWQEMSEQAASDLISGNLNF